MLMRGCCLARGMTVGNAWIRMALAGTLLRAKALGAAGSNRGLGWIKGFELACTFLFRMGPFSVERPSLSEPGSLCPHLHPRLIPEDSIGWAMAPRLWGDPTTDTDKPLRGIHHPQFQARVG